MRMLGSFPSIPGAALAMPGVVAVVTAKDLVAAGVKPLPHAAMFKRADGSGAVSPPRFPPGAGRDPFLRRSRRRRDRCKRAIRHAMRSKPSRWRSKTCPPCMAVTDAVAPGAPVVWHEAPDNIAAEARYGDAKAVEAVFAAAAHVVTLDPPGQPAAGAGFHRAAYRAGLARQSAPIASPSA
jgi:carbon-monoxide dehydrogenase large subunit